jgi:hypothetical protein
MALSFTTTASGASADYLKYLNGQPKKVSRQSEPDSLEFSLIPADGSFVKMRRGWYINLNSVTYPNWFTGYITNDPELEYLGTTGTSHTPTWGYRYRATSDEYILNLKPIGIVPAFTNMNMGDIIKYLANRLAPGVFTVTNVQNGIRLARYVPDPQAKFSDIVKDFSEQAQYQFWANNKTLNFVSQDTNTPGISIDGTNKHFTPSRLSLAPSPDLIINDAIVTGDTEPQQWIVDYFLGDALTGSFPMLSSAFGTDNTVLLDEDFSGASIDTGKWAETDTANDYIKVFSGYLNVVGGTNTQNYANVLLTAQNLINLSGPLRITHGEFDFVNTGTVSIVQGIIGGLWTQAPSRTDDSTFPNCVFGIRVNRDGSGNTFLRPVWAGAIDANQSLQVDYTKRYIIRSIHYFRTGYREVQKYNYINSTGTVASRGGDTLGATSSFEVTLTEINASTGAVSNIYKWTNQSVVLSNSQTYAYYVPCVSNELHLTVTGITLSVPMQAALHQAKKVNVLNAGFDSWSAGVPSNWTWTSTGGSAVNQENTIKTTQSSAAITCGTANQILSQSVNTLLSANKEYRVTARVRRAAGLVAGNLNIDLQGTAVDTTGVQKAFTTISSSSFDVVTALITPQGGLTSIPSDLVIRVFADTSPTNGQIFYVDDLRLYEEWQDERIGPNELDSYDGTTPVATISGTNDGASTKSSILGAPQYNPGTASLTYFKDSTKQTTTQPQVGELVRLRYRKAGAAVGRSRDNTSILTETILWGDTGVRSVVRTDLKPLPRTSSDCEAAAAAIVGDNAFQHYEGSYEQYSDYFGTEPRAGTILQFINLPATMPSITAEEISEVSTLFIDTKPSERFLHTLSFGKPDVTKRFLQRFTKQDNVFVPKNTTEIPAFVDPTAVGNYILDDVISPILTAWDGTTLNYDTNQACPGTNRNKLTFSEQFDNAAWTKETGCTVTANSTLSPDNVNTTADSIVTTTSGNGILQTTSTPAANGTAVTFSVWLKCASGTQNVSMKINRTGTLDEESTTAAVTTGWKKFSLTHSATWTGTTNIVVILRPTASSQTFIAWGAQLESGASVTPYQLQTTGGSITDGGGFEIRYTDESWGCDDAKNLVTRTTAQTFSVTRDYRGKIIFIKPYTPNNKAAYSEDMTQSAAWTLTNGATASITTDTDPDGNNALVTTINSNGFNTHIWQDLNIVCSGLTYAVTGYVRGLSTNIGKAVRIYLGSNAGTIPSIGTQSQLITLNGQWQPFTLIGQYDADDFGKLRFYVLNENSVALSYQLSHVQVEINTNIPTPYVRTLSSASSTGLYSRYASAVRVNFPLIPPSPTATIDYSVDKSKPVITTTLPTVLTDVWGIEIRASDDKTVLYKKDMIDANFNLTFQTTTSGRSLSYYVYTYNLLGEYSTSYNATATIPTPNVSSASVNETTQTFEWTATNAAGYLVEISTQSAGSFAANRVVNTTITDFNYKLDTRDFLEQRYLRVTPFDVLGNGTTVSDVSHVYTGVTIPTSWQVQAQGFSFPSYASSVSRNGSVVNTGGLSYNVLTINRTTGATTHTTYDVYTSAANATTMANDLNALDSTKIVVIYSNNEPQTNRLTNGLPAALERCGASKAFSSTRFRYRSAYILVGVPGIGIGNGIEKYAGTTDSDTSASLEVAFTIKDGNVQGLSGTLPYAWTTDELTSNGTRSVAVSGKLGYTSTTTSITIAWDGTNNSTAITIYRDDGTNTDISAISSGKVTVSSLTSNTTYYFYPYYDEITNTVTFVLGGSGSNSSAHTAKADSKIRDQRKTKQIALENGAFQAATTVSGSGGGTGGGGGSGGGGGVPR